jgi:hypothetical protein
LELAFGQSHSAAFSFTHGFGTLLFSVPSAVPILLFLPLAGYAFGSEGTLLSAFGSLCPQQLSLRSVAPLDLLIFHTFRQRKSHCRDPASASIINLLARIKEIFDIARPIIAKEKADIPRKTLCNQAHIGLVLFLLGCAKRFGHYSVAPEIELAVCFPARVFETDTWLG